MKRDLTLDRPSRATRFAARDPGPGARVSGFLAHLRMAGFKLGVPENETALRSLAIAGCEPDEVRLALKTVCSGCAEDAERFDNLFDAYWFNAGRVRPRVVSATAPPAEARPHVRSTRGAEGEASGVGAPEAPDEDAEGEADGEGSGKLVASELRNLMKKDLRDIVGADEVRAAERIAIELGQSLRDRRSRRRHPAWRGPAIDFRRTIRASLPTGGEPVRLLRRHRPDRPMHIHALCDVSGSMMLYARPFLAFLAGLMRADDASDAWLFHTRLARITEALRDPDPMRALNKVTLLADGMGGGTRIGESLAAFASGPARRLVDGRSVVIVLCDGYDTGPAEGVGLALQRLKRRGCRIVWLNPLKGWADYAPVTAAMRAALPHLDHFAAANTLGDLAALEDDLGRL